MDGREAAASERREPVRTQVSVDPAPGRLRETLARVDEALVDVETGARRRVRLLLGEVIGRSWIPGRRSGASIQIEVDVCPGHIRMRVSGPGLVMPNAVGEQGRFKRPSYPHWILNGLADRWGHDRRGDDFGLWFLLERRSR